MNIFLSWKIALNLYVIIIIHDFLLDTYICNNFNIYKKNIELYAFKSLAFINMFKTKWIQ